MNKNIKKIAVVLIASVMLQQPNGLAKTVTNKKTYNAVITASRLNIRNKPSIKGKVVGKYTKGTIIKVLGQAGIYLKTNKGYIHNAHTKAYIGYTKNYSTYPSNYLTGFKRDNEKYIIVNNDSQIITDLSNNTLNERYAVKNKKYKVIEENDKYYRIKIGKVLGYIPRDNASALSSPIKENINLGWDYVYSKANNKYLYDSDLDPVRRSSSSIGLDALSPTWFDMSGDPKKPVLVDKGDKQYVTMAHKNGYEVWPRFCEMNVDRAYNIFNNKTIREQIINSVVQKAVYYDLDGINIDFEGIGSKNKDGLTAFTRDLCTKLRAIGVSTSIDVTRPDGSDKWSLCYDRPQLAKYVDYIALMAYDEHTSTSPGPTGSYTWVEDTIKKTIAQGVPKEKIILGIPFYMRDYTIPDLKVPIGSVVFNSPGKIYRTPNASDTNNVTDGVSFVNPNESGDNVFRIANTNECFKYIATDGNFYMVELPTGEIGYILKSLASYKDSAETKVKSSAMGMQTATNLLSGVTLTKTYDSKAKQYKIEYYKGGYKHNIWLEDANTVSWRTDFVDKYNLKGVGIWSLTQTPTEDVWNIINTKLKSK